MVKKQQIQTTQKTSSTSATSALERFTLAFEYDKTLQQIKQDVRTRTI